MMIQMKLEVRRFPWHVLYKQHDERKPFDKDTMTDTNKETELFFGKKRRNFLVMHMVTYRRHFERLQGII